MAWGYQEALLLFLPSQVAVFSICFILFTHLFSNPHGGATWVRLYGDHDEFIKYRFYAQWVALALIALAGYALLNPSWPGALVQVSNLWNMMHYTSQVYGIALLYCFRWDYCFSRGERKLLKTLLFTAAIYAILRRLGWSAYNQTFLGVPLPNWDVFPRWVQTVAFWLWALLFAVFSAGLVRKFLRDRAVFPLPALAVVGTCLALMFAPVPMVNTLWLFAVPLFHGSQYLIVSVGYYFSKLKQEKSATRASPWGWQMVKYWALLVAVGNFMYLGIPRIIGEFGFESGAAGAVAFAVVNFHHFLTDSAIWKLRDPRTRGLLLYG